MELGIISLSDLAVDPDTGRPVAALDRIDETLAYARAADELGLEVFTLGEQHTLDPVSVWQDFAQLDLISHGRAEIVAGPRQEL